MQSEALAEEVEPWSGTVYNVLKAHLIPKLRLADAKALRGTSITLRSAVDLLQPDEWSSIAS